MTALFIFWVGWSTGCQGVDPVWFVCLTFSRDLFYFWSGHCLLLGWLEYSLGRRPLFLVRLPHMYVGHFCFLVKILFTFSSVAVHLALVLVIVGQGLVYVWHGWPTVGQCNV